MRKTFGKQVKRWSAGVIAMIVAGMLCGGVHSQIYAGEFGGFDIDIGGDGNPFDDWAEEPEAPQVPAKPEQNQNGGSSEGSSGTNNSSSEGSPGANNNSSASSSGAKNNNSSASSPGANNNSSASGPGASNDSSESSFGENNSSNESGSWGNTNGNESSYGGNTENYEQNASASEGDYASNDNSSEEKNENPITSYVPNSQPKTKSSDGTGNKVSKEEQSAANTDEKSKEKPKENSKENNPTATPSVHKITALGTVFSAVGMAKISPELKFYNSNNENKEETQNTDGNYNKTIYFNHAKTVSISDCPKIKLMRTEAVQDVTILSLRLNGKEVCWHQEKDTILLDEPLTKKNSTVELLAVIDGKNLVKMPVWTME